MPVEKLSNSYSPISRGKIDRATMLLMIESALEGGEIRFARQAVLSWLSAYPGDLEVNGLLAKIFFVEKKFPQAIQILEKLTALDAEEIRFQKLLAQAYSEMQNDQALAAQIRAFILGERMDPAVSIPGWAAILRNARRAMDDDQAQTAEMNIYQALALNQDEILAAITHLKVLRALNDEAGIARFSELYQQRWTEGLVFRLARGESKLAAGDESEAVQIFHQCAAEDASGQVCRRWWGENHPYRPLWPTRYEIPFGIPIPAAVAGRLGWNRLAAATPSNETLPEEAIAPSEAVDAGTSDNSAQGGDLWQHFKDGPEENTQPEPHERQLKPNRQKKKPSQLLKETEEEFERIAKRVKNPAAAKADGRFPIYVVFSTRSGLRAQYGEQTALVLDAEMNRLAEAIRNRPGWGAMVFYPDDMECTGKLGMPTTASNDPWKLKLAIVDLDQALAKKGGRIGALLIVGGNDVVPFHRLPNPTDDSDDEVLSDNPYSTLDSNFFIPEWSIGRMPGEKGTDAGLLLQQLRQAVQYHKQVRRSAKNFNLSQFLVKLLRFFFQLTHPQPVVPMNGNFGYTASVWRRSSVASFHPVGDERSMLISPPSETRTFDANKLLQSPLGFFNLHGLAETAEWYGQRDARDNTSTTEYPVALSLADLPKNGHSPKVILSEACYGGYILEKEEGTSLAMRFLSVGTRAIVASTCIAYGAVSPPLLAADLLANLFWTAIREGYSAGEALVQAKMGMAREMNKRQGFLDGEDQKTLISFVLYGDPLTYHEGLVGQPKRLQRFQKHLSFKTISDHRNGDVQPVEVEEDLLTQAKAAVAPYLPGLDLAEVRMRTQKVTSIEVAAKMEAAGKSERTTKKQYKDRTVVIFQRKVRFGEHTHNHYARVTLNQEGKLVKMAFSR